MRSRRDISRYSTLAAVFLIGCASAQPPAPVRTKTSGPPTELAAREALEVAEAGPPKCGGIHTSDPGQTRMRLRPGIGAVCWQPKATSEVAKSAKSEAVVFKLWQDEHGDNTFLSVHNPYGRALKYRLGVLFPGEHRHVYATSCPVAAGRFQLEHWRQPVLELIVSDLRFLEGAAGDACD